jgi:hypothetical protein
MLAAVPSRLVAEWQAYFRLEPFGETRGDLRNAMLCALTVNMQRGKDQDPVTPEDFMPDFGGERKKPRQPKEQTPEQMMSLAMSLLGGE